MSAFDFIRSGGMASIGGDLPDEERKQVNQVLKVFEAKLRSRAISAQIPASKVRARQATYLLVVKDIGRYHVLLANGHSGNQLVYRDLTKHGRVELASLAHQVRIEVGDVVWAFSYSRGMPTVPLEDYMDIVAAQYVASILELLKEDSRRISVEAVANPEIASGLERFRRDYPDQRVAFIMMQFSDTASHEKIVSAIKESLSEHGIVGLRANDKQYLDDLFPNVRVYMHGCEFGVAVFERILEDDFNPNVSLEVGYMLGMGKDVCLLKDKTLRTLPTDLTGRLYRPFDTTDAQGSLPPEVKKWLTDKGLNS